MVAKHIELRSSPSIPKKSDANYYATLIIYEGIWTTRPTTNSAPYKLGPLQTRPTRFGT